ncbi:MAG: putative DNA binding domain-containing protein [Atopobiaceae bacterium]|nr:putative DNA binding domain-containing protein [Atopobiaceae bacterium]
MAIPTSIDTLLGGQAVEWARIEFKETWDPQASLKTICAFANDLDNWGGGYLVIGVREHGDGAKELVGVAPSKVDAWLKDMLNKCRLIQPAYTPITEVCQRDGLTFIIMWAPGGSQRPYSSPITMGVKSERVHWIRKMASTVRPNHEEMLELYNLANNVPFDDRVNHAAVVSDLQPSLVKAYLHEVGSSLYSQAESMDFVDLCRSMNIVEGPPEYTKPKNVGLMFFSDDPERFFPYAHIDIVELPDGESGNRIFERSFTGPLHQQLRDALRYLRNNVIQETVVKVPGRAEAVRYFNYPYEALEEALANAVYHKGYETREPIEVRVLPKRIEILSHPGADRSISISGLRQYRAIGRRYRNRRIGEFLKELHLTEGRNTGIHKMLEALDHNGSPKPLFETDEERIYFLVTVFARTQNMVESSGSQAHAARVQTQSSQLLEYLDAHPLSTTSEMSQALGISVSTVNRIIAGLKAEGLLRREGSRKKGRWIVL